VQLKAIKRKKLKWNLSYPKLKTLISRYLTQTMRRLASVHLFPRQFTIVRLTSSKSLLWSSRPSYGMWFFFNWRGTSTLQPYFHEIGRLHPYSSIEISNILSQISHHSIFRFWADQVGTFKRVMWSYKPPNWTTLDPNKRCAPLYQLQVVFNDDDVRIARTKPWKWSTQLAWLRYAFTHKQPFFSCVHT
jgi:hypothetical protein